MGYSETSKDVQYRNLKSASSHTIHDIFLSQWSLHWFQGQSWLCNKHFKLWPIAVVINFYCSFLKSLILHSLVLIEKFLFDVIWEEQIPRRLFSGISKQLFCKWIKMQYPYVCQDYKSQHRRSNPICIKYSKHDLGQSESWWITIFSNFSEARLLSQIT